MYICAGYLEHGQCGMTAMRDTDLESCITESISDLKSANLISPTNLVLFSSERFCRWFKQSI